FDELQAARPLVLVLQRVDRGLDVFLRLGVEQLENLLRGEWLGRREDQRFENRLHLGARACDGDPFPPLLPFLLSPLVPFIKVCSQNHRWDAARPPDTAVCRRESDRSCRIERRGPMSNGSSRAARGMSRSARCDPRRPKTDPRSRTPRFPTTAPGAARSVLR